MTTFRPSEVTIRWDAPTQLFLARATSGTFTQYGQGETEREALEMLVRALTMIVVVQQDTIDQWRPLVNSGSQDK